jgi:hypothetical protein
VGILQLPLRIRGTKQDVEFHAELISSDGTVIWRGKTYDSLSAAAGDALASISGYPRGKYPSANGWPSVSGWQFWEYQDANGLWHPLQTLRDRYNSR